MKDKEFLQNKEQYVTDVLKILEKRAIDESELIFQRHNRPQDKKLYTDISDEISDEINELTDTIYDHLLAHPEKLGKPAYKKALLLHFPEFIQKRKIFRNRIRNLPLKYKAAMLSTEIATQSVYHGGLEVPFEEKVGQFVRKFSREIAA